MRLAFPSDSSYSTCKTTQECSSDPERFCASVILIINCLRLLFCDSGRLGTFQLFYKQEAVGEGGTLSWGGTGRVLLGFRCSLELRWICIEGQGVLILTVIAGRMEKQCFGAVHSPV